MRTIRRNELSNAAFNPEPTATAVRFPVTSEFFGDTRNHSQLEVMLVAGYARVAR